MNVLDLPVRIEQINIGARTPLVVGGSERATGIFKEAKPGVSLVDEMGLFGDVICNTKHHGGPDQAVYLYSVEDYAWWEQKLGKAVPAGTFGENFTTSGQDLSTICVGDCLVSDSVTLQITAPRIPCSTLAARMDDKQFAKKFMQAGRSGAYCRVLKTGEAQLGDIYELQAFAGERLPLQAFFHDSHSKLTAAELERYLAAPIDIRTRNDFTQKLAALS